MNYEMLLGVVKATRISARLAENLQGILPASQKGTLADDVFGLLADVLYKFGGERLAAVDSFDMSETSKLLKSELSDEEVVQRFMDMPYVIMPKPNLVSREEFEKNYSENGGYKFEGSEAPPAKVYDKLNKTTAKLRKAEKENLKLRLIAKDATATLCRNCDKGKFEKFGCCDLCRFQKYKHGGAI